MALPRIAVIAMSTIYQYPQTLWTSPMQLLEYRQLIGDTVPNYLLAEPASQSTQKPERHP
jgi:hypothetical protein